MRLHASIPFHVEPRAEWREQFVPHFLEEAEEVCTGVVETPCIAQAAGSIRLIQASGHLPSNAVWWARTESVGADVNKLFNPAYWARALSQPVVLLGLAVDLLPVYGVLAWGWGAAPLVLLYWMENIIIGAMTIPRIVISGASYGVIGLIAGLGLSGFFVFHYGLFCMVHGTFLIAFAAMTAGPEALSSMPMMDLVGMFNFGFASGLHVAWILYVIVGFQVLVFVWEFIIKGEWKDTNPMAEMFSPYGRIIVLHIAIFAGAGALFLLGEPMVGVMALIVLRALFGIVTNAKGVFAFESDFNESLEKMSGREQFQKLMRGEKTEGP